MKKLILLILAIVLMYGCATSNHNSQLNFQLGQINSSLYQIENILRNVERLEDY
jgi:uncharacterized protein YcfL